MTSIKRRLRLSSRWIDRLSHRFAPNLHDATEPHLPAVRILVAAAISAVVTSLFYHLATVNAFGVFRPLMLGLGGFAIPGSQGGEPSAGYLGISAGVCASYFLTLVLGWVVDLRLSIVTIERLPAFVAIAYAFHAVLAWQLFYPWLSLK